uniref:Uncharacterized protein n=1 Tax=Arundo donax TaxID=35708 RepID=A0A0A9CDV1_ARUDO
MRPPTTSCSWTRTSLSHPASPRPRAAPSRPHPCPSPAWRRTGARSTARGVCRSGLIRWPPRLAWTRCTCTISATATAAAARGAAPKSFLGGMRRRGMDWRGAH